MKKIGFIGLGIMGFPMAKHLIEAGYELVVFNRTVEKSNELEKLGAEVAKTPAQVAEKTEVVFTMLANSDIVEQISLGQDGIVFGAHEGLLVINCSTVSPDSNIHLSYKLAEHGIEMLDVPVTGSGVQANSGMLTFMCGGNFETYEKCIPLFEAMGKKSFYMGPMGAGSYTKLANNTMLAINMMSLAEAIVMAAKCNIDPETFVQVVSGGGSKSAMAESKTPKIVNRDFSPAFKSALMLKDVGLALDLAKQIKMPMPVLSVAGEMLKIAQSKGYGDEDLCAMVKCYEEWAGVEVKKQ
ncbi:MAG: NAD(P)-dependent oxidoreductase [Tissierellales bacterium]|jgi:3-hydroxyisobutyrate dehydrogenase-like beta-hydroxyacid dehydrogenase|nr:NAD(P)-dependent oxidoreductase [Tissierellales bacterium]MBN2827458.1 NAD(P)-dependent oxidoreductase [Tissierellales bacterium]